MSIRGRWRVVGTPGYDMAAAGAYILFDEDGGEFAFACLTGCIHGACEAMPPSSAGRETTKRSSVRAAVSTFLAAYATHLCD